MGREIHNTEVHSLALSVSVGNQRSVTMNWLLVKEYFLHYYPLKHFKTQHCIDSECKSESIEVCVYF